MKRINFLILVIKIIFFISILSLTTPALSKDFKIKDIEKIGFQFERGRLDTTAHPFCSTLGPNDCRLTTRWDEAFLPTALYSVLHETGHGLYEQGLPVDE